MGNGDNASLNRKQYVLAVAALILGLLGSWLTYLIGRQEAIDVARATINTHDALVAARQEMEEQFRQLKVTANADLASALKEIADAKDGVANLRNGALAAAGGARALAEQARESAEEARDNAKKKAESVNLALQAMQDLSEKTGDVAKAIADKMLEPESELRQKFLAAVTEGQNYRVDALEKRADELARDRAPIGSVVAWPSGATTPAGWEACKGQPLTTIDCSDRLREIIGTTYRRTEDDVDRLPNFQGMFLRGAGKGAEPIGTEQPAHVGDHDHGSGKLTARVALSGVSGSHLYWEHRNIPSWLPEFNAPFSGKIASKGAEIDTGALVVGRTGEATPSTKRQRKRTRPVNYAVHWIIRVK